MGGALKVNLDKVRTELNSLMPGELIEVHWADASKNYRVKKITNSVVACYKKQVGRFIKLYYCTAYGIEHLLMEDIESYLMPGRPTVWSIPVPVILRVIPLGNKPLKVASDVGGIYLGGGKVKFSGREGGVGTNVE